VRWYYLLTDVDDRRRAEEALRKSEALLHEAQRLARTGSWSWDVLSGRVVSSPENARIYGFQPHEDSAAPEVYFQRIHPDYRERIREIFQACVVEKTITRRIIRLFYSMEALSISMPPATRP
jgi:PAS domain-containing protein